MRRLCLLLCVLAMTASSTPAGAQPLQQEAEQVWADGDRNGAYRLIVDRLRQAPRDTAALALRLDLEVAGAPGGIPFFQKRRMRKTARTLLRIDSTHVRANAVLGRAALNDVLLYQRYIKLGDTDARRLDRLPEDLRGLLPEATGRQAAGRLDLRVAMREIGWIDASEPADAAAERAERHLLRAVQTGPSDRESIQLLATLYVAMDRFDELAALAAVARAARPEAPDAWMLTGLAARRLDRSQDAEEAFEFALSRMSPSERDRVQDISRLTPQNSTVEADTFWAKRDTRFLTSINERRLEHYSRIVTADLLFAFGDLPGSETPRGQIYVRYGEPPVWRFVSLGPFAPPIYPGDPGDTARYDVWQYEGFRYVFNDFYLGGRYTLYSPAADAYVFGGRLAQQATSDDAIKTDRRLRRENPEDAAPQPGTIPLNGLVSSFRSTEGKSEVVIVIGNDDDAPRGRRGLFLLRDEDPIASDVDDTTPIPTEDGWIEAGSVHALPGAYTLAIELETANAYGVRRQRVTVRPFSSIGFEVSDLLMASSIDEVDEAGIAPLQRGGYAIVPTLTNSYAPGDPLHVYAEIYGLTLRDGRSDASVETVLIPEDNRPGLRRVWDRITRRGSRTSYRVATDISGDVADEAVPLFIDTTGQPSGGYTLQLRITDRIADETVVSEREIVLE
ncbi:MAG: GWxTD domain-containing protein [Bacteroidota bacterium]